jgi:hypothetical protein
MVVACHPGRAAARSSIIGEKSFEHGNSRMGKRRKYEAAPSRASPPYGHLVDQKRGSLIADSSIG